MKKFKVVVNQIKSIPFELEARNKKEAEKMVKDVVETSNINDIQLCITNSEKIEIITKRIMEKKNRREK